MFKRALEYILRPDVEGGFVDDPRDPGGLTNMGISLRFGKEIGLTADDIRNLTHEKVGEIYFKHFWLAASCHEMPPAIGFMAFDQAVNQGVNAAIRDLQSSVGAKPDSKFGPQTRLLVHQKSSVALLSEYHARRNLRYGQTKNFDIYGLGWSRRSANTFVQALTIYNSVG